MYDQEYKVSKSIRKYREGGKEIETRGMGQYVVKREIPLVSTGDVSKPAKSLTSMDTILSLGPGSGVFSCSVKEPIAHK